MLTVSSDIQLWNRPMKENIEQSTTKNNKRIGVGIWGRLLGHGFVAVKRWCLTQKPMFSMPRPKVGLLQKWYPGYI